MGETMSQEAKNDLPAMVFLFFAFTGIGFLILCPITGWATTDTTGPESYAFNWLVGGAVFYGSLLGPLLLLQWFFGSPTSSENEN